MCEKKKKEVPYLQMMKKYSNNKLKWIGYVAILVLLCLLFTILNVMVIAALEIEVGDYLFKVKVVTKEE